MKFDEINLQIIKHLKDGRKSFKVIADELSVTENTVRARVNRLVEEGVLNISGLVNPENIPGHQTAIIGVKITNMRLVEKGEEFSKLNGVISVAVVTGRYDLIVQVLLNDDSSLLEFYTNEVTKIDDVQDVETFIVYKGYNINVPYIL
ncbi:MAG: Lrp/AsnC family transcriptional regulator [Spirochaetales bacterium]|uniref:Lrp/AsnC family transcriptional regulator n=1 Tax=Candidatus Thalassospirochaeta sargassi TaxID=3119039 RepID=A0AAJ1ML74_9SPIO|nr:Lrp/AsnC family transcriptional regulator [Spirochaetales bacterium]